MDVVHGLEAAGDLRAMLSRLGRDLGHLQLLHDLGHGLPLIQYVFSQA